MNRRADMVAALSGRVPPQRVPIWELSYHLWDKAHAYFFGEERCLVLGADMEKLPPAERDRALHANAEIILSVADALHFAAITVPSNYWEVAPGVPAYYYLPESVRLRQIEILAAERPGDLMLVGGSGGVMAMPGAKEYVEFSYKLYDAPDEIDARARRTLENGIANARRLIDLGVEIVSTSSDIADNHGPFFNPEQMDRFILPYLRDWAAEVAEMGAYSILHTDGDIGPVMDALADSGVDAIQAIDPVAGMDIRAAKKRVGGRVCLCGNVDCGLLVRGTPEEVFEETRRLLHDLKGAGGWVLGASNAVQREAPIENYAAMIEAWEKFGDVAV